MQEWLNAYSYRIHINVWVFLAAGFVVIFFSFISVSYLSLKAASANLAAVLKDE